MDEATLSFTEFQPGKFEIIGADVQMGTVRTSDKIMYFLQIAYNN
jgi:hypothetical protein